MPLTAVSTGWGAHRRVARPPRCTFSGAQGQRLPWRSPAPGARDCGGPWRRKDQDWRILRPVTRPGMDFLNHVVVGAADLRPDTRWVARGALKPDPHAGARAGVPEQPGGGTILAHAKIDSPVMIEV